MTKRFLSVILITLFSTVAMFANDISTEVQTEQKIQQQATPDFSSNSKEFSLAEKDFAAKYSVNPRNTADVWYKYKKFIRTGIGMAVSGGIMYTVGTPASLGIALGMLLVNPIVSIVFYICSGLIGFAGILVQSLCSVPFAKSAILAGKYKNLYNVKLKHAASEAMILSMHNSENKEFRMAMAFGIK
jgi:hypothetical protein